MESGLGVLKGHILCPFSDATSPGPAARINELLPSGRQRLCFIYHEGAPSLICFFSRALSLARAFKALPSFSSGFPAFRPWPWLDEFAILARKPLPLPPRILLPSVRRRRHGFPIFFSTFLCIGDMETNYGQPVSSRFFARGWNC